MPAAPSMNPDTALWISARAFAMVRLAGTRTVALLTRTGMHPGLSSTSARPVPRSDGSIPSTNPEYAVLGRSPEAAAGRPRPSGRAGTGLPSSFAVHICLALIRAMDSVPGVLALEDHLRPRKERQDERDRVERLLVDPPEEPFPQPGPGEHGGREVE